MLTAEERMELGVLRKHGAGIRELARVTGWSRNTVRRYLREGDGGSSAQSRAEAGREARPVYGKSFRILKGIESDILADGALDYPDELLSRFDFVVASVHGRFKLDR